MAPPQAQAPPSPPSPSTPARATNRAPPLRPAPPPPLQAAAPWPCAALPCRSPLHGPEDSSASSMSGASTSYADPRAHGSSPDSLRNTPSNIARLEDAIEHCAARRKYLARTKSPSDGEDVHWYFCKLPLADKVLSASVPRTEIVAKGDYFRFSVRRDPLALEASFLEKEEALLAYWWREYAECREGPRGSLVKSDESDSEDLYKVEEERVGVPVKGGLYEVDLMRRHCFPVYWNARVDLQGSIRIRLTVRQARHRHHRLRPHRRHLRRPPRHQPPPVLPPPTHPGCPFLFIPLGA